MEHIWIPCCILKAIKCFHTILRAAKNRYGSTNEIGMFDMTGKGLKVVENPLKAAGRAARGGFGQLCTCTLRGSRPIYPRYWALVSKTAFGTPRRAASGSI